MTTSKFEQNVNCEGMIFKGFLHYAKCLHNVYIIMDPQNSNRLIYGMLIENHKICDHDFDPINMFCDGHNSVSKEYNYGVTSMI